MTNLAPKDLGQIIIIRRGQPEEPQAKGGAWKIAYADFVTAMMAFFLVMWLINAANEKTKAQVASYFNPVKLVDSVTAAKGLKDAADRSVSEHQTTGAKKSPRAGEKSVAKPAEDLSTPQALSVKPQGLEIKVGGVEPQPERAESATKPPDDAEAEEELFVNPYALLDILAGEADVQAQGQRKGRIANAAAAESTERDGGIRDPFDPLAWRARKPSSADVPTEADQPEANPAPAAKPAAGKMPLAPKAEAVRQLAEAKAIRDQVDQQLSGLSEAKPNVAVKLIKDGILISLTDTVSFDMFNIGSARPNPILVVMMERLAHSLQGYSGRIIIRGHTDARPYRGGRYDNWKLSTDRAQMAYYMLARAGIDSQRVERIEGYSSNNLLKPDDPQAAENRRIEILLKVEE